MKDIQINSNVTIGESQPLTLLAGPCVIESEGLVFEIAEKLKKITDSVGVNFIFKASYDKANRTSVESFRGPGLEEGLKILDRIKNEFDVPVVSDVHEVEEVSQAADVLDVLQIPAFLCRQTDLLVAAGKTGKVVNVKKGQFLAPWDMKNVVTKLESTGSDKILLTERGTSFGYNTLVTDFRGIDVMKEFDYPVVFDATHSVQQPGGKGTSSGGNREFIPLLSRCAVAAGVQAIFMETHPDPDHALSDGPNMWPTDKLEDLLKRLVEIHQTVIARE